MELNRRLFLTTGTLVPAMLLINSTVAVGSEEPNAADIGFCQDMSVHHLQALAMCQRVLGRDTGGAVQAAAAEVLQNQAMEVGQMRAWLADWRASTVPPSIVMGWMGANQGAGMPISMMPGYASDEQLLELSTLGGKDRGRRWLEFMRAHHVGKSGKRPGLVYESDSLAEFQAIAQNFEISQYDLLLAGPYAP